MTDMKYLDFDVAIEQTADGYSTRVFNSPVGQAAATFTAPFSDLELENFLLRVGRSRHAVRRIESPEMASAKAFGGRLFDQVFTGDVRGCLRSSVDEAGRQGLGLRVRLHLTKVPALADLPWEFLYNASMNRFLSLSVETPLVRYLELPERIRPLIVQPPLRVLMMISSPSDYPQLDVSREAGKMNEALDELERRGLVTVERQEDATLSELQRRLRSGQYHIFHFVGHGGFDSQADDGLLIMEDHENRGRRVSAQFLGTLLHDHRPLRLAVLNACEGARASRGDPFAGTAQSLVQQGIPAVIAMQFEVTDEAAICFTREFYAAIASGYPVDAALAESRKAIFAEVSEIEWGTPVLYMRSPDGKIFEIEKVNEARRRALQISSLISSARTAAASNDSAAAIAKLKEALELDPSHEEASGLLREIAQEKELDDLYAAARASSDAGRWREALDQLGRVAAINSTHRDVQTLMASAERELAKADADTRRRQEIETLYTRACHHADRRNWREALAAFRQLHRLAPDYKDVPARLTEADTELNRSLEEQARAERAAAESAAEAASRQRSVDAVHGSTSSPPHSMGWFFAGGAIGAVIVIALLVIGGVTLAVFVSGKQEVPTNVQRVNPVVPSTRPSPAANSPSGAEPATQTLPSAPARTPMTPRIPASGNAVSKTGRSAPQSASIRVTPPPEPVRPAPPAPAPVREPQALPAPVLDPKSTSPVSPQPVVTPLLRLTLEAAVRRVDAAEMLALSTLNPAVLAGIYTGKALDDHIAKIKDLAANQVVMISRLHSLQFESFSLDSDGRRAHVRLTEVWSTNYHSVTTRQCLSHEHEHAVPQIISFELINGAWLVYSIETFAAEQPLVACH